MKAVSGAMRTGVAASVLSRLCQVWILVVSVSCGPLSSILVFLLVRPGEEGLAFHIRFHQLQLWISVDKE